HTAHEHIMLQFEGDDKPIKFDLVEVETLLDLSKSQTLKKILNQLGSSATDSLKFFASNNRDRHLPYHTLIVNLDEGAEPLIVHYPLTLLEVTICCNFGKQRFRKKFPHTTGLWYNMCNEAKKFF
ncbi:6401_t:CDS:1, partial [Entrophospora sp. SA101]